MAGPEATNGSKRQRCYTFLQGQSAGTKSMKQLLGGKGANLCEMARLGLNVPPGVTITTETCQEYYAAGGRLPEGLWEDVLESLKKIEGAFGAKFASTTERPMLLSVRSGAAVSMPGMMDTVLNLGLNDTVVENLAKHTNDRFAFDCYRRLLDMYANVVLGADHDLFEAALAKIKSARGVKHDVELTGDDLRQVVRAYKDVYKSEGYDIPDDSYEQLKRSIGAVFGSWNTPRAVKYREINRVTGLKGTAVNVQTMVYGNFNENSGTGVCFTRNPATGKKELFGEFLINAQGEDVVAGIRTPLPIAQMNETFPKIYQELKENTTLLETHMKDMQDCEFTVQDGRLFMLQTRNGKRVGSAALRVAMEMQREGLVSKEQAVSMVEPRHLDQLLHPQFEDAAAYAKQVIGSGLAASPGAAVGRVVFTAEDAEDWRARGERVLLVRTETSPEDVGGMHAAEGILTSRGGMTSHAAVVARGWGKPCVCGCEALTVHNGDKLALFEVSDKEVKVKEGEWLSINGTTGEVILGKQAVCAPKVEGDLAEFMSWVDSFRKLQVLTNADTPEDAAFARVNGAQGIGLVRTEHMFFSSAERIAAVRRMIAAEELHSNDTVLKALKQIQEFQTADFSGIFEAMDGLPVTIRMLDPPLHEFLPKVGTALTALAAELAKELGVTQEQVSARVHGLQEANPMIGFRGCRLGIVHPEITTMQVNAIIQAAIDVAKKGKVVKPHIMVPLVGSMEELEHQIKVIRAAATATMKLPGNKTIDYKVGTMIEVPRAALIAGTLARVSDFFSFGTNDLTQMTFGFSRDDAEQKFLPYYTQNGILACDPFERIDAEGVGELIKIATERGLKENPDLDVGVCGEHGGDPTSISFFDTVPGMTYVSCSPLRVPIARLAAAQSQLALKK